MLNELFTGTLARKTSWLNFEGIVKIIDFGIAKAKSNLNTTQAGVYKGKPAYMAPEYISPGIYDHRFDQFSLGVVFWELATGKSFSPEKIILK